MNIDYSLLFLAYISIADECIYDKSLVFINEYIIQYNISEESKNEMHKILGDTEDKISLDSVLQNMASYDKEKINENTPEIKACIFCKSVINLVCKKGMYICTDCIKSLKNAKAGDYFY